VIAPELGFDRLSVKVNSVAVEAPSAIEGELPLNVGVGSSSTMVPVPDHVVPEYGIRSCNVSSGSSVPSSRTATVTLLLVSPAAKASGRDVVVACRRRVEGRGLAHS
jgi:hypothetical protein